MTREEIEKEIVFADMVLGVIKNVKVPMLMYDEEKDVVRKALTEYKYKLESEMRGRWGARNDKRYRKSIGDGKRHNRP